ncbi:LOW QUALITY PROTEIN: coiled-coil domain-containing protein 38 [Budorcas taxicolor]|uniref:LOW QUALITY PROTEIN: coiled-coil domain-containing protein 38 n=1 Tax=Budorcas taxicolor TaxID=37181 RepID=UPI002283D110|nr:LOW QUALITY PROTEIN: coiled-coil domain-containing protein 38 [Budorcas taxicolor]
MSSQFLSLSPVTPAEKEKDETIKKDRPYKIFFKDLFLFKENEMAAKKREKFLNRNMKVYQKSTFSSRMKNRSHLGQIAIFTDTGGASVERLGLDPTLILRLTEGADTKRTIHEFISDQRDRFMLEYTLSTKRNTIQRFEKHTAMKERKLMKAEKKLEEDAVAFEEFLRENDQRSVDALKMFVPPTPLAKSLFTLFFLLFSFSEHRPIQNRLTNLSLFSAAQETINKLQMTAELKKASLEIQSVKSEIAKTEFLLREYMKYGLFLMKLSPKQWQIQQAMKKVSRSKENVNVTLPSIIRKLSARRRETTDESRRTSFSEDSSLGRGSQARSRRRTTPNLEEKKSSLSNQTESISSEDSLEFFLDDDMDYDLEPELYFKEPEELLQVLTELEEQNLTLVQYSQDVDENLEDVNKREKVIQDKINTNIEFLLEHKELLKANCVREEEKAAELELRSRLFSFGEYNSDAQEKLIDSLSKKINQVYKVCIGDAEVGSLNPVQKLVKVETRLVELSDLIDSIPKENVEAIERMKQKERRQRLREEKMREKQKHQEERLKAALERAVAQPKKKKGRQLIYRSKPPSGNKHELLLVKDTRTKSLEEEYFFT